jgi:hypothetical protein
MPESSTGEHYAEKKYEEIIVMVPNILFWKNRPRIFAGHFEYEERGPIEFSLATPRERLSGVKIDHLCELIF